MDKEGERVMYTSTHIYVLTGKPKNRPEVLTVKGKSIIAQERMEGSL